MEISSTSWRVGCHSDQPVTGRVVIIHSQADLSKVRAGDIMVANQTDVNYTAQMEIAGAIITVEGGRFSHAATFSREKGIPCITGVTDIMEQLCDGDIVTVDTHAMTITVINR